MKSISFEILQKDTLLKFLSEMSVLTKSLLLEIDLQKDLIIAKAGSDYEIITFRKDELKLSEVLKFNKESDIPVEKIKGRIILLIFDLNTLVKTIRKFVSDGDVFVFKHDNFNAVANRKAARLENTATVIDVPSIDITNMFIQTKGKLETTFTFLCGEIKDFVYFSDALIEEMNSKDKYQFNVISDEEELKRLLELSNTFSNINENINIKAEDKTVTFTDGNWKFALNDSKVEGSGELSMSIPSKALKEVGVSPNYPLLKIGDRLTFTDKEEKTLLMIANLEESYA
ncbi:MAG: hypothetical protein FWC41_05085 [Firmicutes bacterium]|nr:hypothetical protein [Bacillota bacterium]